MVVGIVAKNGILLLDADQKFRSEGTPAREAMIEAGERRLRPILMTALATMAGMIPLSLAIGKGSQMLHPLADRGDRRGAGVDGAVADRDPGGAFLPERTRRTGSVGPRVGPAISRTRWRSCASSADRFSRR